MSSLNQVRWRCRRGMLELDVLLEGFLQQGYSTLDADQQCSFAELLLCEDQQLFDWCYNGKRCPNRQWGKLIEHIRQYGKR